LTVAIEGSGLRIRGATETDRVLLRQWHDRGSEIDPEGELGSFSRGEPRPGLHRWVLMVEVEGNPVGALELRDITWRGGRAELHEYFPEGAPDVRRWAITEFVKYALERTRLKEIYVRVRADCGPTIECLRQCGFRPRGKLSSGRWARTGKPDVLLLSVRQQQPWMR